MKIDVRQPEGRTPTWDVKAVSAAGTEVRAYIVRVDGGSYEQVKELPRKMYSGKMASVRKGYFFC